MSLFLQQIAQRTLVTLYSPIECWDSHNGLSWDSETQSTGGDVPQNEAELPLRADGPQDKAHPTQGHDIAVCRGALPIAQILSGTSTDSGWVMVAIKMVSFPIPGYIYSISLFNRICGSNSTDRCKCVSLKCHPLAGQYDCVWKCHSRCHRL